MHYQFEQDTVLVPKETSWFGYYPDGAFDPILPAQEVIYLPYHILVLPYCEHYFFSVLGLVDDFVCQKYFFFLKTKLRL
jgi:hypothetical protein